VSSSTLAPLIATGGRGRPARALLGFMGFWVVPVREEDRAVLPLREIMIDHQVERRPHGRGAADPALRCSVLLAVVAVRASWSKSLQARVERVKERDQASPVIGESDRRVSRHLGEPSIQLSGERATRAS